MRTSCALLLCLMAAACRLTAEPVLTATEAAAPEIDGDLSDPCWQQAEVATNFVLLGKAEAATQQTEARVVCTPKTLYFAFDCAEDRPEEIVATVKERDADVFTDDCIEVFLAPNDDPAQYYHFVVNADGVWLDERRQERHWNSRARAAARRTPRGYAVELEVPLSSLEIDATASSTWALNLCREERPHGEISSWAPMEGGFHEPERFGRLTGLDLDLAPFARATLASRCEWNKERADCLLMSIRQYRSLPLTMAKRTVARTARVDRRLGELGERLSTKADMATLREAQQELDDAEQQVGELHRLAAKLELAAAQHRAGRPVAYAVSQESPMRKLRADETYARASSNVVLSAARNEYEPVQVVVVPIEGELKQVSVAAGPLTRGEHTIGPENITVNVVGFVDIKQPSGRSGAQPGRYADPLLDNAPVDIPADAVQPFWITYYVPRDTPAGIYEGSVAITPAFEEPTELPVELTVWDFDLPRVPLLRTSFGLSPAAALGRLNIPSAAHIPSAYTFGTWTGADIEGRENYFGHGVFRGALDAEIRHGGERSIRIECDEATPGTHEGPRACYHHDPPLNLDPGKYSVRFFYRTEGAEANSAYCSALGGASGGIGLQPADDWREAQFVMTAPEQGTARLYFGLRQPGKVWFDDVAIELEGQPGVNLCPNPGFDEGDFGLQDKIRRAYLLNCVQHRCAPTDIAAPKITYAEDGSVEMDWTEFDEMIGWLWEHGLSAFNINWAKVARGWGKVAVTEDPKQLEQQKEILRQTEAHLAERGWDQAGYLYIVDEPGAQYFPELKQAFGLIKETTPKLKTLLTFGYGATRPHEPGRPQYARLAGAIDIWVPHSDCFDREFLAQRREAGEEVWDYVCISAQKPYANMWGIDYPGTDHRVVFWQCFAENMDGFLYWQITYWKEDPWTNPMTYPGGNGDGSLLYPRDEVGEGKYGPINSIRWELCREGIEDFDYLRIAEEVVRCYQGEGNEKMIAEGRKLLDISDVTKDFTNYTNDPAVIEQHRRQLGAYISRSDWPFIRASR